MRFTYLSILLLCILPFLLLTALCGATNSYEAYLLNNSEKLLKGLLPYRDFHFIYTPAVLFFNGFSFVLFKASIFSSRLLAVALYLLASAIVYKIVFISTKNIFYATLAVVIFVALGPSRINFPSPETCALFTGLICNYLLLKFIQTRHYKYLFIAGIACFSVFLSEQFAGIMMLIPIAIFFSVKHARNLSMITSFLYGYIWGIIFFVVYLLLNQSFPSFIYDLQRSFVGIGSYITSPHAAQIIVFSTIMLIVSFASAALLYIRRRFHLLFLPFFCVALMASTFLSSNIDKALYVALIGIPIALYLRYNISSNIRLLLFLVSFLFILHGFQNIFITAKSILNKRVLYYQHSKVNVFQDNNLITTIENLRPIVDAYTKSNEYIFVDPTDAIIYFIMNRKDPSTEDSNNPNKAFYYKNVISNIIAKRVKLLALRKGSVSGNSLRAVINSNYTYYKTVNNFDIFLLRS